MNGQVNLLAHLWPTKHDPRIIYCPSIPFHSLYSLTKMKGPSMSDVVPTLTSLTKSVLYIDDIQYPQHCKFIQTYAPNIPLLVSGC